MYVPLYMTPMVIEEITLRSLPYSDSDVSGKKIKSRNNFPASIMKWSRNGDTWVKDSFY